MPRKRSSTSRRTWVIRWRWPREWDVPGRVTSTRSSAIVRSSSARSSSACRVATAGAGVHVIGVDSSAGMLEICAEQARLAGVADRLDLRLGDLRRPPVEERVPLVTCPFRAYLHLGSDAERLEALRAARSLLLPGGRLVFDVFAPSDEDIEETHGLWLEREPGIFERADWDRSEQTLTLSVRGTRGESSMTLWWLEPQRWQALLAEAGFAVDACYGWFDRRPYDGGEDTVWIGRRK